MPQSCLATCVTVFAQTFGDAAEKWWQLAQLTVIAFCKRHESKKKVGILRAPTLILSSTSPPPQLRLTPPLGRSAPAGDSSIFQV